MRAARTAEKERRKSWREAQCWLNLDLVSTVLKGCAWTQGQGGHSPETGGKGGTTSLAGQSKAPRIRNGGCWREVLCESRVAGSKPSGHSKGRAEQCCDIQ